MMEVPLPLSETGCEAAVPTTVSLEVACGAKFLPHPHISRNTGNAFCVFDETQAVVSSLDEENGVFSVLCVLFFRKRRSGRVALSLMRASTELLDVSEGLAFKPLCVSQESHVSISEDAFVATASFPKDDIVAITSRSGQLGCISLTSLTGTSSSAPPLGFLTGHSVAITGCDLGYAAWATDPESHTVVRLTASAITCYRFHGGDAITVKETKHDDASIPAAASFATVSQLSSPACFVSGQHGGGGGDGDLVTIVIPYRTTRDTTVLRVPLGRQAGSERADLTVARQPLDLAVFPNPEPQIYFQRTGTQGGGSDNRLVAALYPDCVTFGTATGRTFAWAVVLKNELSLAFSSGCWEAADSKGCRFLVFRVDAFCLAYEVAVDETPSLRITEVTLASQFPIPFLPATCMSSLKDKILAVKDTGALLCNGEAGSIVVGGGGESDGGDDDDVQWGDDGVVVVVQSSDSNDFRSFGCATCFYDEASAPLPTSMRVLEVLSVGGGYNVLAALDNGECLVASTGKRGRQRIAVEDAYPQDITSCLAFERDNEAICVLGFRDGNVKVFAGGHFSCLVRMAHCGPVDKLACFSDSVRERLGCGGVGGDDTSFVSISTQLGTICFHSGRRAEITKTLTSPSHPLTACYVDRRSEYLFAMSNSTGNLWHLPTCRLERTFTSAGKALMLRQGIDDLLATHWPSTMGIRSFPFLGRVHYSINVNVAKMVAELGTTRGVSRDVAYALPLLLRGCGMDDIGGGDGGESTNRTATLDNAVVNVLEDLSLCVSPGGRDAPCFGAIALACAIAEASQDKTVASQAVALSLRLHDRLGQDLRGQDDTGIFYTLFTYFTAFLSTREESVVGTLWREGFARVVRRLPPSFMEAVAAKVADVDKAETASPSRDNDCFAFLAALLATRTRVQAQVCATAVDALRRAAMARCTQFVRNSCDSGVDGDITEADRANLLALSEGYVLFADSPDMQQMVARLVLLTFTSANAEVRCSCATALAKITAADPVSIISGVLDTFSLSHAAARPNIVVFLAHFVKAFPIQAGASFGAMLDLALKTFSLHVAPNISAEERTLCSDATMQMVRVAATHVPSISLQQNLLQVAVGQNDGKVKVYNLKTAEVVTTFHAHKHPIVCLSYSSNTTSHDIATVSAAMDHVKVFRAHKPAASIVSFFSAATNQFKLETEVDLPATQAPLDERAAFARYCGIKWLSPQCVEFSSPWHERIQMTL